MKRWVLLAAVSCSVAAQAADLKALLAGAEKENLDRRISLEQRQKAAAEYKQAWTSLFPSVIATGGWTHNQYPAEFTLPPAGPSIVITPRNQLDALVRFEVPLLDTTRWFRAGAAGAADDAAGYRDALMLDNVRRQVASTYYSYAALLAVSDSAKRSLSVATAQLNLQDIRAKAGAATELEVLRAKAEVQRNKQIVADTEGSVAITRRALQTLTGIDVGDSAPLPNDDLSPQVPVEELEGRIESLPAVKASEKDALAASRLSKMAHFALVPLVSANFTERLTNATGFIGRPDSYTAGIGLSWRVDVPTFYNMSAQSSQAQVAKLAAERQRLSSRDLIHSDWRRLTTAMEKVAAARVQVESAQRAAQVARDRYVAGAATQIDVIQAERDLFSSEVTHIQARTELASSHVSLRISAGLPLGL